MKRISNRSGHLLVILFFLTFEVNGQTITTVAGGGLGGGSDSWGTGLPATNAILNNFCGLAIDKNNNIYIADKDHNIVRKIERLTGIISTIAGTGVGGFNGDGITATSAQLNSPGWIDIDSAGSLYISDRANHRIRKVDASGLISTVAGTGVPGYTGDNALATNANISAPQGIFLDDQGEIFIADCGNRVIRKVGNSGEISTVAGTGLSGSSGDGGPATAATFMGIYGLRGDHSNNIFVADWNANRVRRINLNTGIISTVAGNGLPDFSSDNIMATASSIDPFDVSIDKNGNIYIADFSNHRVRRVNVSGVIVTIAGIGISGFDGDGENATNAKLNRPAGVMLDTCENLYIADNQNGRIRKVNFNPECWPVNVKGIQQNKISIYPNPANEELHIDGIKNKQEYKVYSVVGTLMRHGVLKEGNNTIDVRELPAGMYMVEVINSDGKRLVRKIVKQ